MSPPLTLRDFLQYVLPTVLAACMFVPFAAPHDRVSVEGLVFGSVALSYLVWQPAYRLAQSFYEFFPPTRARTKKAFETSKRTVGQWAGRHDKLRYMMTSDEREYLYSHGSFAALYAVAGFYLFVYAALNLFLLVRAALFGVGFSVYASSMTARSAASAFAATAAGLEAPAAPVTLAVEAARALWKAAPVGPLNPQAHMLLLFTSADDLSEVTRRVLGAATPSVINFQMNTLTLFAASAVLCYFAYKQYHLYYDLVFKEGGQYDLLAEKYLSDARVVWGQVKYHVGPEHGGLFRGAVVTLRRKDGAVLDTTKADANGRFQLADKSAECWTAEGCEVYVDIKGTEAGKDRPKTVFFTGFKFGEGEVGYAELRVPKPS